MDESHATRAASSLTGIRSIAATDPATKVQSVLSGEAEHEGFDAVCLDTVSDAGVPPLRSLPSVPVLGAGEISNQFALCHGSRFSVLTECDRWVRDAEDQIAELGLVHAMLDGAQQYRMAGMT